jgi:hypothetical protein
MRASGFREWTWRVESAPQALKREHIYKTKRHD